MGKCRNGYDRELGEIYDLKQIIGVRFINILLLFFSKVLLSIWKI